VSAELRLPEPLAALLVQRGFGEPEGARRFLRPALEQLTDPLALAGMPEAVAAIAAGVRRGTPIMVHGDYDVDGQCSAAILVRTLRLAGATVVPFIPHRLKHGYDFGAAGLEAARAAGVGLVLTCDCGITAVEPVRLAREAGMEVVVTDHHLLGEAVPAATAIVNPQRPDDASGLRQLCGAGIAFMLARALVPVLGLPANFAFHLLDLAALATVADVVPLRGDNRVIVRHGLRLLAETRWTGVRALIAQAGLAGKEIRAGQVGFILGPRLNAAGRLGDAMDGLALLLTDDELEAKRLAARLETLNGERQALDQRMLEEALAEAEAQGGTAASGFVLHREGWHAGVVGIVASRVVERYGRPTFLVALDGETGKGSGRSISRFDLHGALHACGDLLERFGGHRMAAGLTVRRDRLPAFRERFNALVAEEVPAALLGPEQRVDLVIRLADATAEFERLARHLEPCGTGNPSPVLGVRGARLAHRRKVGANHLKGVLQQGGVELPLIGFGWWDRVPWLSDAPVDVAFRLESDTWQGEARLQAKLCAIAPAGSAG
jgi:single-stranded-DNA-specific exonuclease